MQNIVLITRENSERTTSAAVFLCNRYVDASSFSRFINHLALAGGERFYARHILVGCEYALEKKTQFAFEDLVNLDDKMIQRLLVEVDSFQLAKALGDSSEEVQNKIFRNMPRRAVEMLKEDMRFVEPVDKEGADNVKRVIIDIYYAFSTITSDDTIENAFYAVRKKADEKG